MALFIVVSLIIGILFSIAFGSLGVLSTTFLGVPMLIFFYKLLPKDKVNPNLLLHITIAQFVGFAFVSILYFEYLRMYGVPFMSGGTDDYRFELARKLLVDEEISSNLQLIGTYLEYANNSKGYIVFLVWVTRFAELFGSYDTVIPRMLNIYFLNSVALISLGMFYRNFDCKKNFSLFIFYSIAIFPNALFISAHVFRDVYVLFLLVVMINIWDLGITRNRITFFHVILTAYIAYLLYFARFEMIFISLSSVMILMLFKTRKVPFNRLKRNLITLAVSLIAIYVVFSLDLVDIIISRFSSYTDYRLNRSDGLSNFVFGSDLFPFGFILRYGYALISPFPSYVIGIFSLRLSAMNLINIIVSIGTIYQIYLLPFLFKNIKKVNYFLILFLLLLSIIAFTTFTFRHFVLLYPFMIILSAIGLASSSQKAIINNLVVVTIIGMLGAVIYVILI